MITQTTAKGGVKVTFSLDCAIPVSVVGSFNGWDPIAHPLRRRSNGRRSVSVVVPPGTRCTFRYLADGGQFFDDPDADTHEDNGIGETHGVLVAAPPLRRRALAPVRTSADRARRRR